MTSFNPSSVTDSLEPQAGYFRRHGPPCPVPRPYFGATVTGSTDDTIWKKLMREWYYLRPVSGMNWIHRAWCLHWITGKRCSDPGLCSQEMSHGNTCGIWDHARAWKDLDGNRVITLEPYGNPFNHAGHFASLRSRLRSLGLVTSFEGRSPYGASYILFVTRNDTTLGEQMSRLERREHRNLAEACGTGK